MTLDTTTPKTPITKRRWFIPTLVGVIALFIGVGIGNGGDAEAATKATPTPTVTVTSEPEIKEVEVEKVVTETVAEVPQACLDALSDAEALQAISGEMANDVAGHMASDGQLFEQFSTFDFENVDWYLADQTEFQGNIEALTGRVNANTFTTNAAACRAA